MRIHGFKLAMLLATAPLTAGAQLVYDWTGACTAASSNCAGHATGVLVMADTYVPGTHVLDAADFISWNFSSDTSTYEVLASNSIVDRFTFLDCTPAAALAGTCSSSILVINAAFTDFPAFPITGQAHRYRFEDTRGFDWESEQNEQPFFQALTFGTAPDLERRVPVIPEPGTYLLMGLGLAALGCRMRARKY